MPATIESPRTMAELVNESLLVDLREAYGDPQGADDKARKASLTDQIEKYNGMKSILLELMTPGAAPKRVKLDMQELATAADFKVLFPKVVMEVLQRPKEYEYIGQSLLSRTIQVDGAQIWQFPTFGAIQAFEVGDTQEIPEQDPSITKHMTEIRTRRFGVRMAMGSLLLKYSQWDILGMYIEEMGRALRRKKEQLVFEEYDRRAVNLFDNSSTDATKYTKGRGSDNRVNGTFDHLDLVDMIAALAANGFNPRIVALHPLSWAIWAKDPNLRFQLLHTGGVGATIGAPNGAAETMNANQYIPFGLTPVITPFQTLNYEAQLATGLGLGVANCSGAANYTTISVVDPDAAVLIMSQMAPSMAEWENPARDIQNVQLQERYGLQILNGGRSAVTAKNVRIDQNYKPLPYRLETVAIS